LPEFAHARVDAGASAFVGHGPHVLCGIEIYKGRPIFYSLGNFIFAAEGMRQIPKEIFETCGISGNDPSDFFDKAMRGFADAAYWESVVAQVGFEPGELREIKLYPAVLQQELPRAEGGMPLRANAAQSRTILGRLAKLCGPFGTKLAQERRWDCSDLAA
jgi:poly-gamma-glutamate synthesis protein (capsule biosynthesis protein)